MYNLGGWCCVKRASARYRYVVQVCCSRFVVCYWAGCACSCCYVWLYVCVRAANCRCRLWVVKGCSFSRNQCSPGNALQPDTLRQVSAGYSNLLNTIQQAPRPTGLRDRKKHMWHLFLCLLCANFKKSDYVFNYKKNFK